MKTGKSENSKGRQLDHSPTLSEQSVDVSNHQSIQQIRDHNNALVNQSVSRLDSMMEEEGQGGDVDLLISDIQHNQSRANNGCEQEDLEQLLKTGAFTKEMMMG